ncbi:MAG: hypothetical protein AAGA56_23965, partial [Myxococcota bacterium]
AWPHAEAVTMLLVNRLKAVKAGMGEAPSSPLQMDAMTSQSLHDTSMSILRNMGDEGCTKHYDGVYYLGCW